MTAAKNVSTAEDTARNSLRIETPNDLLLEATSESVRYLPVHRALARVMEAVQSIGKASFNSHQKYPFRGIDDVVNAVGPALREHGVIVMPEVLDANYRDVSTTTGKTQHECTLRVRYTFTGPAGDSLSCVVQGEAADALDKATPQAMSVAYRIALLQALCIPTGDVDPDSRPGFDRGPARTEVPNVDAQAQGLGWASQAEQAEVWTECVKMQKALGEAAGEVLAWGKAEKLSPATLTPDQGKEWYARLTAAQAEPDVLPLNPAEAPF